MKQPLTVPPSLGESFLSHVSCISVWQCAQHESTNKPLERELLAALIALRNCNRKSTTTKMAMQQTELKNKIKSFSKQVQSKLLYCLRASRLITLHGIELNTRAFLYIKLAVMPGSMRISNTRCQDVLYLNKCYKLQFRTIEGNYIEKEGFILQNSSTYLVLQHKLLVLSYRALQHIILNGRSNRLRNNKRRTLPKQASFPW